jgi:hypothetical protein
MCFKKAQSLSHDRAKSIGKEEMEHYFTNLETIMSEYDLHNKPHLIYNIDETGFSPMHTSPKILTKKDCTPQAITSPRSTMVTCIAACNAIGNFIPPYLVLKGKRLTDDLKIGSTPGCGFKMSDNGWSNGEIFKEYLQSHFLKFVKKEKEEKLLCIYDGSTTHINIELIKWAKMNGVILFVLPPHLSHLLQPLDVGCFSPLKNCFNSLAHTHMKEHPGEIINRYNLPALICKSYTLSLTPSNIMNSFRKTGIYPFDRKTVDKINFLPSSTIQKLHNEPLNADKPNENNNSSSPTIQTILKRKEPTSREHKIKPRKAVKT